MGRAAHTLAPIAEGARERGARAGQASKSVGSSVRATRISVTVAGRRDGGTGAHDSRARRRRLTASPPAGQQCAPPRTTAGAGDSAADSESPTARHSTDDTDGERRRRWQCLTL
jgi:hypothetical protein